MRILALDWGTVRVGAAISDEMQQIAFPLKEAFDSKQAIEEIKKLLSEYEFEKILVGLPKSLAGGATQSSNRVNQFIEQIKNAVAIPVETMDERFSSVGAGRSLEEQGLNQKEQREIKDNITAQLMLQSYLDTKI